MNRKVFLRWLLLVAFTANSGFVAYYLNFHKTLYATDAGAIISSIILTIFVAVSARLGIDSYNLSLVKEEKDLNPILDHATVGKFAAGASMGFGMIGTIIGMRIMLSGFDSVEAGNYESVSNLMDSISSGFGAALDTTLLGLAGSILLSAQCFNILYGVRKIRSQVDGQ